MVTEYLVKERMTLDVFEKKKYILDLTSGDHLVVFVKEDGGNWVNAYLMDEGNYRKYRNGESFKYWGERNQSAINMVLEVERTGTYYLIVQHNKDIRLSPIVVEVTRISD